jgi:hypothetical protein
MITIIYKDGTPEELETAIEARVGEGFIRLDFSDGSKRYISADTIQEVLTDGRP